MASEKYTCPMCGKSKRAVDFWKTKAGGHVSVCKTCACSSIDVSKPKTFMWVLKEVDVPFIEETWVSMCKKRYMKDPDTFSPLSIVGSYLRAISNMPKYSVYGFADTEELNREHVEARKRQEAMVAQRAKELEEEMAAQAENGDGLVPPTSEVLDVTTITQEDIVKKAYSDRERANYRKRKEAERQAEKDAELAGKVEQKRKRGRPRKNPEGNSAALTRDAKPITVDEEEMLDNLTSEDVQYLALKWGESFRPSEWIKMEEMYNNYCQEFEIGVDRESVLIAMCKTSINMQRCLDSGDAANASKFSTMFDQLRKSGAFTEAQKKEDKHKYLDSVGELVAAVEREGGVIPQFDYQFEVNQDKVDLTLKDMQSYTYNLVKNEMGLGDLIESYIKKLDEQREEEQNRKLDEGLITGTEDERQTANDVFADSFLKNLEDSIASEADSIYSRIGDDS